MAIFKQGEYSCYFIHIPRTGGRHVSSLFENSENVECKHHKINTKFYEGVDVAHLHYPLYTKSFDISNIPHITVVRNPLTRFVSTIKNVQNPTGPEIIDFNKLIKSEDHFLNFMMTQLFVTSVHNNWFRPQNQFISNKTHVWKYEWGFGENFKKWVYKKTNIKISISQVNYEKFEGENDHVYKLSRKLKSRIKKYYKDDYKKFWYFW